MTIDFGHFANPGMDDFAQWLPQNDFQFDPQLFGGYRDPQENVLSHGFDDSFFKEALEADFITPYNQPISTPAAAPKTDLIAKIDAAKEDDEPAAGNLLMKCNEVWYVGPVPVRQFCRLTNNLTGRKSRTAPRRGTATSTWTVSAPTCRRRPSATATAPSSARMISSSPSRSTCARTKSQRLTSRRRPRGCRRRCSRRLLRIAQPSSRHAHCTSGFGNARTGRGSLRSSAYWFNRGGKRTGEACLGRTRLRNTVMRHSRADRERASFLGRKARNGTEYAGKYLFGTSAIGGRNL